MSKPTTRLLSVITAAVLLGGLVACTGTPSGTTSSSAGGGAAPTDNPTVDLHTVRLSVADGADAGAADGRSLRVPSGWRAEVWADVPGARMAAWLPDGSMLVTTGDHGTLLRLDPRGNGKAPRVDELASGLEDPQGVAVTEQDGSTVVVLGEGTRIVTWHYRDGALSGRRVLVDGLPTGGHGGKFVAVHDGVVAYDIGSASNSDGADRRNHPDRAVIRQVHLDGTDDVRLATGVRNGEGLGFAPDGTLFAAVNQADNQPYPFRDDSGRYGERVQSYVDEHPNDQVTRITRGTELGWPFCQPDSRGKPDLLGLGYVDDPTNNPDGKALDCATVSPTMVGLPAHSAPIGFVFTRGSALPAMFGDGALITTHGSWNRQPPRPPSVSYSAWDDASRTLGQPRTIVEGFQDADGSRWGRSVDAVPGPDGSLYVTDDAAGLVYRLTPAA
ncbi:sugar dehydrogenase [Curtobacterium sp. 'Ferrero']|uniref:PQQ-dependent sugar dehydrogenase n=1 Tax=Curtobacterium sp. 'Ferrero' TaxID=2033654 RepID=UPI000BCAC92C|nr:sugar dehydrogenase [Curtobacterium sp. 'Ferrero']PCN48123.1 sugar dehydrogenase [Curtobacterium sp. 'Ferrero']